MSTCATCRCYKSEDDKRGYCRRYPQAVFKVAGDWCFEYQQSILATPQAQVDLAENTAKVERFLAHEERAAPPAPSPELASEAFDRAIGRLAEQQTEACGKAAEAIASEQRPKHAGWPKGKKRK